MEPDQAHAPITAAENGERSPAAAVNALPWPIATGCLLLGTAWIGWVCAVAGQSREGPVPTMLTLMLLLGSMPFFSRRLGGYSLVGVLVVTGAGLLVALLGWLLGGNPVVFVFLVMGGLLSRVFHLSAYGRMQAELIELEENQPGRKGVMATRTRQAQSMLWVGDFVQVVILLLFLWWAYSWWRS